jgi:tRNA G18 (ribose-2'-O)-methylase SpoU
LRCFAVLLLQMPQQLAIVMGSEAAGVSQEIREAADR